MNDNFYSRCSAEGLTIPKGRFPENTPLAMAYVPYQSWEEPYAENVALAKGTIFPKLDLPFYGREGVQRYGK
ncbi:MAG: spore coat associated protein CotJA [Oscillospiraceae bacterium]|nr:spore coat associated protein CotJA [Oscillospiraceae bacterium]